MFTDAFVYGRAAHPDRRGREADLPLNLFSSFNYTDTPNEGFDFMGIQDGEKPDEGVSVGGDSCLNIKRVVHEAS